MAEIISEIISATLSDRDVGETIAGWKVQGIRLGFQILFIEIGVPLLIRVMFKGWSRTWDQKISDYFFDLPPDVVLRILSFLFFSPSSEHFY